MTTPDLSKEQLAQLIENARSLKSLMRSDPHRPIYHFVAPEGPAMPFDPNGAIYWKGKYHLGFIYQKTPNSDPEAWSPDSGLVWGHVVSTDLLHWTQYPDMLGLDDGGPEKGIFSGGAFLSKDGRPHLIYHGYGPNANFIADAIDDELKAWKKRHKPVLAPLDPNDPTKAVAGHYSTFDPFAWFDKTADCYYQISGGMKPALFKSKDLEDWAYLGDLIDRSNTMRHASEDVACPAFFALGGKSVLLFTSHQLGVQYYIGSFDSDRFTPERHGRMNWPGGTFFTAEHLQDGQGRTILWGWVVERKPKHLPYYGWYGVMSLPRVLALGDDGQLRINPPDELKTLRLEEIRDEDAYLPPHSARTLKARGKSIELQLEISGAENAPAGLKVFASPDGREETTILYDPVNKELVVDFSKSSITGPVSLSSNVFSTVVAGHPETVSQQRAPLALKAGESLKLDIFLDRAVIEIFANGVQCVTQVVYPELEASTGVVIFSGEDAISVKGIRSWSMAETNPC